MPGQNAFAHIVVFHADAKNGLPFRMRNEAVHVIDIYLCFEEGRHQFRQLGRGSNFNHEQLTFGEGEAVFSEQATRGLGIVHNDADNGGFGRVEDRDRQDMDCVGTEKRDKIVQPPHAVGSEDRKLSDRVLLPASHCLRRHASISHIPRLSSKFNGAVKPARALIACDLG